MKRPRLEDVSVAPLDTASMPDDPPVEVQFAPSSLECVPTKPLDNSEEMTPREAEITAPAADLPPAEGTPVMSNERAVQNYQRTMEQSQPADEWTVGWLPSEKGHQMGSRSRSPFF